MGKLATKLRRDPATSVRHRINAGRVAVQQQVDFFHRQFGSVASDWKADDTRVTFADFAISEKLFAELRGSFPKDDFCSEESSPEDELMSLEAEFCWVLDPIDGTNNYFFGIPLCAISLALLRNGEPIYGFVYDLARGVLTEGGPDFGVLDGNTKVTVKSTPLDRHSIISLHFPLGAGEADTLQPWLETYRVRSFGSSTLALTYAALGKLDGSLDCRVKVWDIAAAYALIKGAGGEFHWYTEPVFPLRSFHVDQPKLRFAAGSLAFVEAAAKLDI
ncbi:inositol monophosphatase family protein [Cerasicoccus arenae]|uniref:Inositol monophosphatase n=1 Tax=Cerasicoccus arenae TaxID=424488 RepID=A0A8J3GEK8_9BACT|nr:inositol monophosphatase [Cerasicoccus arenae]MBK1858820.1 inositol monophosphatase [Cerasicoccus arenae]GHC04412.1 inositol monophosphatase [Cerasicoccus arenae]